MVALDGTEKDERALSVAAAIADLASATIHLVHVVEPPTQRLASQAEFLGLDEAAVSGRREAMQQISETALRLTANAHHHTSWDVLEGKNAADELIRHARERDVLVVVMATRAASAAGLAIGGSVADRVMRECSRPVLLVPPRAEHMKGKRIQLARVLVPLDGSALAAQALDFLLELPHADAVEYVLLEAVPTMELGVEPDEQAPHHSKGVAAAEERLERAAARIRARLGDRTTVETIVVESDEPAGTITHAVRELFVEIIAMSTRGAGGLRRLVLGSVAEGVVRASEVPVLLLTPSSLSAQ